MGKEVDKTKKKRKRKDDVIGNTVGRGFANWIFGLICIGVLVFGGLYLIGGSFSFSSEEESSEVTSSETTTEIPEE